MRVEAVTGTGTGRARRANQSCKDLIVQRPIHFMPASDAVDICVTDSTAFILVAEDAGLVIIPLTDFMLRSAPRQLGEWQLRDASTAELQRRGKVFGNELANSGFLARVNAALVGARLQPQRLTIKLTQNIPTERLAPMPLLLQPRRPGIEPRINDFGIGKSPVPRLPSLPVTRLKIDPAFVDGLRRVSNEAAWCAPSSCSATR